MKKNATQSIGWGILIFISLSITGCSDVVPNILLSEKVPEIDKDREAKVLTAFFGLDNGLTRGTRLIYKHAPGKDGMPVVFSHEIEPSSLQGADFAVTSKNGDIIQVEAASLLPANEEFELRTVLLIGEYGSYPENEPVSVEVIGDLLSRSGHNYKGASIEVIPLKEGPTLSYAEYFTFTDGYPYVEKGRGADCPKSQTKTIVRAVWSGGVRAINGDELGLNELNDFKVTMNRGDEILTVSPFQLADLSDNDNNIDLCLKEEGIPVRLEVNQNIAIDPNNDKNPYTEVKILSRW